MVRDHFLQKITGNPLGAGSFFHFGEHGLSDRPKGEQIPAHLLIVVFVFRTAKKGVFHILNASCLFFDDIFDDLIERDDDVFFASIPAAFVPFAGRRGILQKIFRHADGSLMMRDHLADKEAGDASVRPWVCHTANHVLKNLIKTGKIGERWFILFLNILHRLLLLKNDKRYGFFI